MRVYFVGSGPGDPELITCKGKRIIEQAHIIIYAGSLVNQALLTHAAPKARIYDSSGMTLDEVCSIYRKEMRNTGSIARLHSGDPSLYGAIQEQMDFLKREKIPFQVIPGVTAAFAAAAALSIEYTLPNVNQTLILTRAAGRTGVPENQAIENLAVHQAAMAVYLSADQIDDVVEKLLSGYTEKTPACVIYKASWLDQKIVHGTLKDIAKKTHAAGITRQALILVGESIAQEQKAVYEKSKLYDPSFSHGYRKGTP
jgi:precorrin-4/cobalt-precorrin-4 C11-methyltransferase